MLNVSGSTMGAEIGLLSMTQIQNLSQSQHHKNHPHPPPPPPPPHHQQNPNSTTTTTTTTTTWMWNPKDSNQEEDDSWEVRAFAEDTRNIMGTTWPPRSYTCTFCGREFRSAQALGGHMNVHRRDRARLHHQAPLPHQLSGSGGSSVTATFINVPAQELVANAGLCFLYHLPSPNSTTTFHSSLLSSSSSSSPHHYPPNNNSIMMQPYLSSAAEAATLGINGVSSSSSSFNCCNSSKVVVEQPLVTSSVNNGLHLEELDLELRLGHKPTPT